MGNVFFISDHHFGHKNILQYETRPFNTIEEMNEGMIARWNSVVSPEDWVIYGGDFALGSKAFAQEILESLNGTKILVRGNHDGTIKRMEDIGFKMVANYWWSLEGGYIVIHNPADINLREWAGAGCTVLHGHTHSRHLVVANTYNISAEALDYTPKTLEQIKEHYGIEEYDG